MGWHNDVAECPAEPASPHQECEVCGITACLADCCNVQRDGFRTSDRPAAPVVHWTCKAEWERIQLDGQLARQSETTQLYAPPTLKPGLVVDVQPNGWVASRFEDVDPVCRPAPDKIGEEIVQMLVGVMKTPRETEDQARNCAQALVLTYRIERR